MHSISGYRARVRQYWLPLLSFAHSQSPWCLVDTNSNSNIKIFAKKIYSILILIYRHDSKIYVAGAVKTILWDRVSRVSMCIKVATIFRHVIENKDEDFNELAVQILEGHSKMALMVFNFFPNLSRHTRALFLMICRANGSWTPVVICRVCFHWIISDELSEWHLSTSRCPPQYFFAFTPTSLPS